MARTKEVARMSTGGIAPLKKSLASICASRFGTAFFPRTPPKATPPKRPVSKASPPVTKAKQPAPAEEVCITFQFCKKRQRLDTEIVEQCRRAQKRKRDAAGYVDLSSEEGSGDDSEEGSGDDSEEGSGDDSGKGSRDDSEEGSGDDSEEGSGDDSEEGSRDDSEEGSGDDSEEGSGDDSEDDSKEE